VPEIGVAHTFVVGDDSVVATHTVRAGGCCVDGDDVMRRSRLGTGMMMDDMGDSEEVWHGTMA
jgi:hypothetical protein